MSESGFDERMEAIQAQILEEARKLYSATVMDHAMAPRNHGQLEEFDGFGRVTGSCGDTITFWLQVREGSILKVGFETTGCATTVASASMAGEMVQGLTLPEARRQASQSLILDALEGLPEESEHCALLAARAMQTALDDALLKGREPWKKLYGR